MFERKIKEEQGILIEKKIIIGSNKPNEVLNLTRMKFGTYNTVDEKRIKQTKEHCLYFMTKKGRKAFVVPHGIYHNIEINSLGVIKRKGSKLLSFAFEKLATKKVVEELEW